MMCAESKSTVAHQLHAAFLRGEKIAPPEFARRIGVSTMGVHHAIRAHFAGMLREEEPRGTRNGAVLVCISIEEMRQWKPRERLSRSVPTEPLGYALRAAFLRGEQVVATTFAERSGYSRKGVSDALKTMERRGLITGELQRPSGRGNAAMVWSCPDLAAMKAYQPQVQTMNPMAGRRSRGPRGAFAALLEVWGIRATEIALPALQHRMAVPEDDMEVA